MTNLKCQVEQTCTARPRKIFDVITDFRRQDRWLTEEREVPQYRRRILQPGDPGDDLPRASTARVRPTVTEFERPTKITFHQPMAMALHSGTVDVTVRYMLAPTAQSTHAQRVVTLQDPLAAEAPPAAAGTHLAGRAAAHLARAQGLLRNTVLAQGRVFRDGSSTRAKGSSRAPDAPMPTTLTSTSSALSCCSEALPRDATRPPDLSCPPQLSSHSCLATAVSHIPCPCGPCGPVSSRAVGPIEPSRVRTFSTVFEAAPKGRTRRRRGRPSRAPASLPPGSPLTPVGWRERQGPQAAAPEEVTEPRLI